MDDEVQLSSKVDVFFCSALNGDGLRNKMRHLCQARWNSMGDMINLSLLAPAVLTDFQRRRRIVADHTANSEVYIVADDDCFLPARFNLFKCLELMQMNPSFSMISLMPQNAFIAEWTPTNYQTIGNYDIMEHVSVGGIRFCRKGHLIDWPPMDPKTPGYDLIHADAIRKTGKRVGYYRHFSQIHLGEGFSTVWNQEKQ